MLKVPPGLDSSDAPSSSSASQHVAYGKCNYMPRDGYRQYLMAKSSMVQAPDKGPFIELYSRDVLEPQAEELEVQSHSCRVTYAILEQILRCFEWMLPSMHRFKSAL